MRRVRAHLRERHLVRAERPLRRQAVDFLGPCPALGRAEHDHRPPCAAGRLAGARTPLDRSDLVGDLVQGLRHQLVHPGRVRALHEPGRIPVPLEQRAQLLRGYPGQHGRIGDLVAVQMQHRQHGAVARGVEELVRVPARRERAGLGLAVADHAAHQQIRVVERGAVGVRERVAELPALVDRPWRLRRHVTGDPAGEGELPEQRAQPRLVAPDVGVYLAVGPLQVDVRDQSGAAVAGTGHVEDAQIPRADHTVQMRVDEVQPRGRAPVAEQPRLDVTREPAVRAGAGCRGGRSGRPRGSWPLASRRRSAPARARRAGRCACAR